MFLSWIKNFFGSQEVINEQIQQSIEELNPLNRITNPGLAAEPDNMYHDQSPAFSHEHTNVFHDTDIGFAHESNNIFHDIGQDFGGTGIGGGCDFGGIGGGSGFGNDPW